MNGSIPFRNWLVVLGATSVLVGLSMAYADIPIAEYVHAHITFTATANLIVHILEATGGALVLLLVIQAWAGLRAMQGRSLFAWMELPMLCTWSGVWALTVAIALKQIVGRAEVYPTYIRQHSTEFRWLHGSPAYQAFPSGTTCVAAAVLAVIWIRLPKLRAVAALALGLTVAGLVTTNSHWLSDTLAGAFIGGTIGWMTVLLLDRRRAA